MSQSPELSGTAWFNLSAVQLGLVVWFIESYSICSCSICKPVVCPKIHQAFIKIHKLHCFDAG